MRRKENKDWYTGKWENKRALKVKARRDALRESKRGKKPTDGGSELIVFDDNNATQHGTIGTLAGISYPHYTILSDGKFLPGRKWSNEQGVILNQLAVGDRVVFELDGQNPIINGILARQSQLVRLRSDASRLSLAGAEEQVIAANIDLAVIVAATTQPTFHHRFVDRYLVACQYGNVKSLLCMTKTDLAPMPDLSTYKDAGLTVIGVSNKSGEGITELMAHLEGKTCILVGNSGVGKSSLINSLLRKEIILTGEVSEKTGKGKHTTSATSLHLINGSTFLIDTPGIRALGLQNIDPGSLRLYFPEFRGFAADCKFADCSHYHEPQCAVKEAVEAGSIPRKRYDSYIRLLTER